MATQQEFDAIIKQVLGNRGKGASKLSPEYQSARDQAARRLSGGKSTAFKADKPAAKKSKSKSSGKPSGGKKSAPKGSPQLRTQTPNEGPIPEGRPDALPQVGAPGLEWLIPLISALAGRFRPRGGAAEPQMPGSGTPRVRQTGPMVPANADMPTQRVPNEPDPSQGRLPPSGGQRALPPPVPAEPPVRANLSITSADEMIPDEMLADPRVQEMIRRAQAGTAGMPEFMADPARGMRPRTPITTDATPRFRVQ